MHCPACGAPTSPGASVCRACSQPLSGSTARAASLTIGRDPSCDVVLPAHDSRISRRHARIHRSPSGELWIEDLGAANGVSLNGQPVRTSRLHPTDRVTFGTYSLPTELWLPRLQDSTEWRRIGRDPTLEIVLPANLVSVSSRHARVRPTGPGRWELEDLGSSNGTFVNGARIQRAAVSATDQVSLGSHAISLPHLLSRHQSGPAPIPPRGAAVLHGAAHAPREHGAPPPQSNGATLWVVGIAAAAVCLVTVAILASKSSSMPDHVVTHEDVTDGSGVARFVDAQTGEAVTIHVLSDTPGKPETPAANVTVGFLDTDGYEAFAATDPSGRHHPTLEVYPHNSSHTLSVTPASVRPFVTKELRGEPVEGLLTDLSEGCSDVRYLTKEEMKFRRKVQMWMVKPVLGKATKFIGFVEDSVEALAHVQGKLPPSCFLDCYSFWEAGGNIQPGIRVTTPADESMCDDRKERAAPEITLPRLPPATKLPDPSELSRALRTPTRNDCEGWEHDVSRCVEVYCTEEGRNHALCNCWRRGQDVDPRTCQCVPKQFDEICRMFGADALEAPSCRSMRSTFATLDRGCLR